MPFKLSANPLPDPVEQSSGYVTRWVYGLSAGLIVAASISMAVLGYSASSEADRQALLHEQDLFASAVQQAHLKMSHAQTHLVHTPEAVLNIDTTFQKSYVTDKLLKPLWQTSHLERSYLIGKDNHLLAWSDHSNVSFGSKTLEDTDPVLLLAQHRRHELVKNWPKTLWTGDQRHLPNLWSDTTASYSFATIDGTPMVLSAVTVQPQNGPPEIRPEKTFVLVSAMAIDAGFLENVGESMPFPNLHFHQQMTGRPNVTTMHLRDISGATVGYFEWTGQTPGIGIWRSIVPMILLMALLLLATAMTVTRQIAKLSRELEQSVLQNRYMALHDPLTGLANRMHFSDLLDHAIDQLPTCRFALIACDLDSFKPINDTHGHIAGDRVIQTVANRLSQTLGDRGQVARVGGDEFLILVADPQSPQAMESLANALIDSVNTPIEVTPDLEVSVGLSVGIAMVPECGLRQSQLISAADSALYEAKRNGRNQAAFFNGKKCTDKAMPKEMTRTSGTAA